MVDAEPQSQTGATFSTGDLSPCILGTNIGHNGSSHIVRFGVPLAINLAASAATRTGPRPHNEDTFVALPQIYAVADGMGGHAAGEVASGLVADALSILASLPCLEREDVLSALRRVNDDILLRNREEVGTSRMGTTVCGVALLDSKGEGTVLVFNVGDSRAYLIRSGVLTQITVDHSVVQELIDAGEIEPSAARTHPQRNVVTRVIGGEGQLVIDTYDIGAREGDRLLICSDGVTGELTDNDLAGILRIPNRDDAVQRLLDAAIQAGTRDNATAAIVDVIGVIGGLSTKSDDEDTQPRVGIERHEDGDHQPNVDDVEITSVPFDLSNLTTETTT